MLSLLHRGTEWLKDSFPTFSIRNIYSSTHICHLKRHWLKTAAINHKESVLFFFKRQPVSDYVTAMPLLSYGRKMCQGIKGIHWNWRSSHQSQCLIQPQEVGFIKEHSFIFLESKCGTGCWNSEIHVPSPLPMIKKLRLRIDSGSLTLKFLSGKLKSSHVTKMPSHFMKMHRSTPFSHSSSFPWLSLRDGLDPVSLSFVVPVLLLPLNMMHFQGLPTSTCLTSIDRHRLQPGKSPLSFRMKNRHSQRRPFGCFLGLAFFFLLK